MAKILITFFSRPGENYVDGEKVYLDVGNTKIVADELHEILKDADMFEIVPANPYSDKYDECNERAKEEDETNAFPMLAKSMSIENYDTIIIGFPLWYRSYPRPVSTFIQINKDKWIGKKVYYFCTNEEGYLGMASININRDIGGKGGIVCKGISFRGKNTIGLKAWAESINN